MDCASHASDGEPPPESGRPRILLVDDEPVVRDVASSMLSRLGYHVELAEDGAEAVQLYARALEASDPYEAVITDLVVPDGMGGQEAAKELLAIDSRAKVIVSTGYGAQFSEDDHRANGFCAAISKPFTLDDLTTTLTQVGVSPG